MAWLVAVAALLAKAKPKGVGQSGLRKGTCPPLGPGTGYGLLRFSGSAHCAGARILSFSLIF